MPESLWPEFKQRLQNECKKIKLGSQEDGQHFMGPVMFVRLRVRLLEADHTHRNNSSKQSFDKITSYIEKAKQVGG